MIDGHPLVRLGVRNVLAEDFAVHEVASRSEGVELVQDIGSFDVAIVDMRRTSSEDHVLEGHEAIRVLRKVEPSLGVVAYGERPDRHFASAALHAGAAAYVSRTSGAEELLRAAEAALAQESFIDPAVPPPGRRGRLTRRQRQILQMLANGESTAAAARELDLSEETIKTHTKNALVRLGARNRAHGVAIALRDCLIE